MAVRKVEPSDRPCTHRGGKVRSIGSQAVYRCALHGHCSMGYLRKGIKTCIGCRDRDGGNGKKSGCGGCGKKTQVAKSNVPSQPMVTGAVGGIARRNLMYHVCPLAANDLWRDNVRQIRRRMHVFNGRKVIAVVEGDGLLDADVVRGEFAGHGCKFLVLRNDPVVRETATFHQLLLSVRSCDPAEATFFAHTKGNSTADSVQGARRWRNAMYHYLLDGWEPCMKLLGKYPAVGTTKMTYSQGDRFLFPSGLVHGTWMFSGTFFWFRHDRIFGCDGWRTLPLDRYGVEAWLGGFLDPSESCSVFQPWPEHEFPEHSPYSPRYYPERFEHDEV